MTPDELMRQAHLQDDVERARREHAATREALAKCSAAYNRGRDRQAHLTDALKAVLNLFEDDAGNWPRITVDTNGYGSLWGRLPSAHGADVVRAARRTLANDPPHIEDHDADR